MMAMKRIFATAAAAALLLAAYCLFPVSAGAQEDAVVLRICNWEEYIDEGKGWEEIIDLESGNIYGKGHPLVEDFEQWYFETYGIRVKVEYSTFGTNEDLYNMLTIGDVYDLVCPSDYMIMKLMAEDRLVPLSEAFKEPSDPNNYYVNGLSPYIRGIFDSHEINGEPWSDYSAGYMWGITGFVYNPDVVSEEDASTWKLLENKGPYHPDKKEYSYYRRITMKDNVRDSYFAAVGALKSDLLTSPAFCERKDYAQALQDEMNDVSQATIDDAQYYLQKIKDNLYSFETDSGKADMITGKVVANYQWSGDAVFAMDEAEKDGYILNFAVPRESTNIYFDGWVMLKCGIGQDRAKQHAAEAFINFVSRPDNAIRNMYIIGYTSVISAAEDGRIFEYLEWNYSAEVTEYSGDSFEISTEDEDIAYYLPKEDGEKVTLYLMETETPEGYEEETEPLQLVITAKADDQEIVYSMTIQGEKSAEIIKIRKEEETEKVPADETGDPEKDRDKEEDADPEEGEGEEAEEDGDPEPEEKRTIVHDSVTVTVRDEAGETVQGASFTLYTAEAVVDYDASYFFAEEGSEEDCMLTVDANQLKRQLSAQYPSEEVIGRASIMVYFNEEQNEAINRMWVRVRCFNINSVPVWVWIALAVVIADGAAFGIRRRIVRNRQYE